MTLLRANKILLNGKKKKPGVVNLVSFNNYHLFKTPIKIHSSAGRMVSFKITFRFFFPASSADEYQGSVDTLY